MTTIIEKYYASAKVSPVLMKRKLEKLERHADITAEFEYWIEHKEYLTENCVEIHGYTAKSISELFVLLNGEGAFLLLIELRENPAKALTQIKKGFKIK